MTTISAKTILRSRHAQRPDKVLSTLLCRYPRWIHAEGRTHRLLRIGEDAEIIPSLEERSAANMDPQIAMVWDKAEEEAFDMEVRTPSLMEDPKLSRNASSSRALPVEKLIQDVLADPAVPMFWGANQKGMQGGAECTARVDINIVAGKVSREHAWLSAMNHAIHFARAFAEAGYHKQIVNRLLEPFSHITVVVSATEWSNFLALRDHADAEPHIRMLAQEIRKELDREDNIQTLEPGQWHLPFVTEKDFDDCLWAPDETQRDPRLIAKSVACCASTSYKTVDGFDMTMERAIALHDKLVSSVPLHASPCEHVAQADEYDWGSPNEGLVDWHHPEQHANFVGFRQYRKMLPGECQ